ncbi:MAG: hypothetical protein JWL81_3067 [Verrucomicrobiales bacterium]|nr:hypothetical protein [Verrucomicrobiales bacterium]
MKWLPGIGLLTLSLQFLTVHPCAAAPESVPALPTDGPPPAPPALPVDSPVPDAAPVPALDSDAPPGAGVVPKVKLEGDDKIGRTYAEGSPFNIWGGNRVQRASLFTAAGIVRRSVLDALHQPDQWHHPILIQIRPPLADGTDDRPPVWTTISQVEGGFRIEINLVPRRHSVPGPLLQENLVRAILADLVLKRKSNLDLTGAPTPPPDWLLHGTLALLDYRQLGRMSQTFSQIFALGRVLSVNDILNADPQGMDSVSMTIYRVSSGALLMMLIEQPKGSEHLTALLPTLATAGIDQATQIERAFPSLAASTNGLSKWWSLQIAALSQPGMEEVRAPDETERQLAEALVLHYTIPPAAEKKPGALKRLFKKDKSPAPAAPAAGAGAGAPATPAPAPVQETCSILEYAKVLPLPDSAAVFNQADLALTRLSLRAHPIYRPIIEEYRAALKSLAKGKAGKAMPATLARLAATRENLASRLLAIENYIDVYETMESTTFSGAFEGYLKTADELERPLPGRNDPLTRYLDQVEAELGR